MNSTVATTILSSTTSSMNTTSQDDEYHRLLLGIYSVVFLCGTISLSLMIHIMKSSSFSATSITVLNLIFAHFIFLLTVPFRIYYYATHNWDLGEWWCKTVSSMIHTHMYMSFIFYVIILITRLLTFYHKTGRVPSFQRIHAFLVSALVWIVLLVVVPCIIYFKYGEKNGQNENSHDATNSTLKDCFKFGESIKSAKAFNYFASTLIIVVAITLTALQAKVLWVLYRKHHQGCNSQQDFGAQLKSLCFALIMLICLVPYHIFRLYYLEHLHLQGINEVLLSLTTFNCLDMLTFLGRRTWNLCFFWRAF